MGVARCGAPFTEKNMVAGMRHENLAGMPAAPSEVSLTEVAARTTYLEIDGLWKVFGNFTALKGVSLSVEEGEFVCFLGPSGCGKTTLLRAIAGLDLQTRGSIRQGGRDISTLPPSKRDYGIVFQSYALFPNLTIERNIAFGLRVAELLAMVGLTSQAKKYPAQLSGGQQQRIALARAMAIAPGLLLLDEPLSALDAKVRVHLRHEIKKLQRQLGVTTIMVTHDQEEALVMADRIVVMNHGVIEQVGTPIEIYRQPRTLFVADFIGETNQIPARILADGRAALAASELASAPHGLPAGADAIVVIRPVDIIPHSGGAQGNVGTPENLIDCSIGGMDFLGGFWRCRLASPHFGEHLLSADFSMNAVRRLGIAAGAALTIELPRDRVLVFAKDG
jgi:iron(III) transport system ATP-binding protein